MKNKKIICLSFVTLLASCHTYNGYKIPLPRSDNGSLITIKADQLYDLAITREQNCVVLFGDNTCKACESAKETFTKFASSKHVDLYYCLFISSNYSSEELTYEQEKIAETINYNESSTPLSEQMDLPFCYFFVETTAAICVTSNFSYALNNYITVS